MFSLGCFYYAEGREVCFPPFCCLPVFFVCTIWPKVCGLPVLSVQSIAPIKHNYFSVMVCAQSVLNNLINISVGLHYCAHFLQQARHLVKKLKREDCWLLKQLVKCISHQNASDNCNFFFLHGKNTMHTKSVTKYLQCCFLCSSQKLGEKKKKLPMSLRE